MKKLILALSFAGLLFLNGCFLLWLGAGVAGGVAISKDTVRLERDVSYDQAWSATYDTLEAMGVITMRDKDSGRIEAEVNGAAVDARIQNITPKTIRIDVKARKNLMPNIDTAMQITNKIGQKLK